MTSEQLSRAIGLIHSGEREEARELLQRIVAQDPTFEKGWLWLVETLPDDTQRVAALEMCLKFNPDSQLAKRGLNLIMQAHAGPDAPRFIPDSRPSTDPIPEPTTYDRGFASPPVQDEPPGEDYLARIAPFSQPEPDLEELTFQQVELPATASSPSIRHKRRKRSNPILIILAVILLVAIVFFGYSNLDKLAALVMPKGTQPTETIIPATLAATNPPATQTQTPQAGATSTVIPTALPEPGAGSISFNRDTVVNLKVSGQIAFTDQSIAGPYLSPDWKHLAIVNATGVNLISIKSGQTSGVLRREIGTLTAFTFSPDGSQAATLYTDHSVFLWDLVGSSAPIILRLDTNPVAVTFTSDQKYLAVEIENKEIQFFELSTRKFAFSIPNTMDVNSSTFTFKMTPDNRVLTIERDRVSENIAIRIYNLPPAESVVNIFGYSSSYGTIEISPSGKYLATGGNGRAIIYDTITGKELYNYAARVRPDNSPFVHFSPLETFIIIDSAEEAQGDFSWPNIYDLKTGDWIAKIDGNITKLNSIAISPDELLVALQGSDATSGVNVVEIYGSDTGQLLVNIPVNGTSGWLEFSPDNTLLLSVSPEGASYLQTSQQTVQ